MSSTSWGTRKRASPSWWCSRSTPALTGGLVARRASLAAALT